MIIIIIIMIIIMIITSSTIINSKRVERGIRGRKSLKEASYRTVDHGTPLHTKTLWAIFPGDLPFYPKGFTPFNNAPFERAVALQPRSRNCSPAPELGLRKFVLPPLRRNIRSQTQNRRLYPNASSVCCTGS